jgi:Lon-like protease
MRWMKAFFLPVSLALLLAAALIVPLPLFLEYPGTPTSLAERIDVEVPGDTDVNGDYLLMSVRLPRATVAGLAQSLIDDTVTVLSPRRIVPSGVTDREYFDRQRHLFQTTGEFAAAYGLQQAGLMDGPPEITGEGALVRQVVPDAPADGVLEPGDVVVEADGQAIATDQDLRGVIPQDATSAPAVRLRVLRAGEERTLELQPRRMDVGGGEERVAIGVLLETHQPRVDLPVPVSIDTGRIGGPSAGLMIALTVFDKAVTDVDLTGGRVVAGTGVLTTEGEVRSIGGIRQKVVAAHRVGADVFLSPAGQLDIAQGALPAGSSMQVVGVATFDEARQALETPVAQGAVPSRVPAAIVGIPPRSAPGG